MSCTVIMSFDKLLRRMEKSKLTYTPVFSSDQDKVTFVKYVSYADDETIKYWMTNGEIYGELFLKFRSTRFSYEYIYILMNESEENARQYLNDRFKPYRSYAFQNLRQGETLEVYAIQLYEQLTYQSVIRCKHMVNRRFPWLIAAPDGLVVSNGTIYKGIEIKSTSQHSTTKLRDLCNYAITRKHRNDDFVINKQSRSYCQIQICMAIANLPKWDLIIYFRDQKIRIFEILYDEKFINHSVNLASRNYFMYYLPKLTQVLQ